MAKLKSKSVYNGVLESLSLNKPQRLSTEVGLEVKKKKSSSLNRLNFSDKKLECFQPQQNRRDKTK